MIVIVVAYRRHLCSHSHPRMRHKLWRSQVLKLCSPGIAGRVTPLARTREYAGGVVSAAQG